MRTLMSGGGTAGHIYPALTVAERLAEGAEPDEVLFVGTPDGLESRLVPQAGIRFFGMPARGYDRSRPLTLLTSTMRILLSTFKTLGLIRRMKPDVVAGFGGYVSLPVGLAAILSRTPLVLHEQNSVPGLANRVLSRWADAVGMTYEESLAHLARPQRAVLTGNPVRAGVLTADRQSGRSAFGVRSDEIMLLVFGGSRGARHINRAMVEIADRVLEDPSVRVVHVAGRAEAEDVQRALDERKIERDRYAVLDYLDDMGSALAASDVIVARAGATSIAEITAIGRASVLVPYPYATDDHQTKNAKALVAAGGAIHVADSDLDSELFAEQVTGLLGDPGLRATMAAASSGMGHKDATGELVGLLRAAAGDDHNLHEESNR